MVSVAPVDAVGAERYEIYHDALGQAMLDWRERRVEDEQRAEIAKWRRLGVGLIIAMVLALGAMGYAWVQSQTAKRSAKKAEDSAAFAEEKKQEAQKSAEEATTRAQQVANLVEELQEERDEKARKEVETLRLQGKFDEAEKLLAESVRIRRGHGRRPRHPAREALSAQVELPTNTLVRVRAHAVEPAARRGGARDVLRRSSPGSLPPRSPRPVDVLGEDSRR